MNLAELLALPGVKEECFLRSTVGFMALHGGSQDRGTDLLARQAAAASGASYYAIVQPTGQRVHLTSRHHNPDHSVCMQAFLEHVEIVISIHGFGREGFALWVDPVRGLLIEPYGPALLGRQTGPLRGIIVGGRNTELLAAARRMLHDRFEGFHLADEQLRLGFHPDNPVNLSSARGVQIELPPGLRGIGDLGELLEPRRDEMVIEVIAALVELADLASELVGAPVA